MGKKFVKSKNNEWCHKERLQVDNGAVCVCVCVCEFVWWGGRVKGCTFRSVL